MLHSIRSAFALRDAVVAVATVGALASLAIPVLSQVKFDASRQKCVANYRFIGEVSGSYVNDHAGKMWALNWTRGMKNPMVPTLYYFSSDSEAQSWQAVGILRRLANLTDVQSPVPSNWMPQALYSHAALLDYINDPIPAPYMICPEDWARQYWAEGDFSHGYPASGENGTSNWRWIYSSSYRWDVFQWSPSRQYLGMKENGQMAYAPMPYHITTDTNLWSYDGDATLAGAFGPRNATDVLFPSNKVFLSDDYARHNGKLRYFAYQSAGQDLLFHDGSVRYYRPDSTNPGWNPASKSTRSNMTARFSFTRKADLFGGLDNNAASATFTCGWYRWTRGGLNGWDIPRLKSMTGKLPSPGVVENEVKTNVGLW